MQKMSHMITKVPTASGSTVPHEVLWIIYQEHKGKQFPHQVVTRPSADDWCIYVWDFDPCADGLILFHNSGSGGRDLILDITGYQSPPLVWASSEVTIKGTCNRLTAPLMITDSSDPFADRESCEGYACYCRYCDDYYDELHGCADHHVQWSDDHVAWMYHDGTLPRDYSEVHFVTNLPREIGIQVFQGAAEKMQSQSN